MDNKETELTITTARQYKNRLLRFKGVVKAIESKMYIMAGEGNKITIDDLSEELSLTEKWKTLLDSELDRVESRITNFLQ